jgi:hypothetical protein
MILSHPHQPSPDPGKSDSFNCIDLVLDANADATVRPCRPSMLAKLQAERDKVARWAPLLQQNADDFSVELIPDDDGPPL